MVTVLVKSPTLLCAETSEFLEVVLLVIPTVTRGLLHVVALLNTGE